MRYINIFILIIAVLLSGCKQEPLSTDYPDSDAVYINLTKTFILNKDGSIVERVEKSQKLFTYRSFQSLFGDTRIAYNPNFQTVNVSESFTVMADGKIVNSPDNAYNEVLPRFCANSKAYNNMRELVVSHTALERDAVINCKYEISTTRGIFPFLMGDEALLTSCPVENLTIKVQVPAETTFNYELFGYDNKPKIVHENENDIYTWSFKDLPQHIRESHEQMYSENNPRLVFSTQESRKALIDNYGDQAAFRHHDLEMPSSVEKEIAGLDTDLKKALRIQQIVVDELNLLNVPGKLTGFRYRTAKQIWESNSGTAVEKVILISSLLTSAEIANVICLDYPNLLSDDKSPFLLASSPLVIVNVEQREPVYLSPKFKNSNYADMSKPGFSCMPVSSKIEQIVKFKPVKGEMVFSGELTLSESSVLSGFFVGIFTGSSVPYLKAIASENAIRSLMSGWKSKLDSLSEDMLKVVYSGEKKTSGKKQGDYCFVTIPAGNNGLMSKHLLPLSAERKTTFDFGHPLKESYSYSLTVPEKYELINKKISKKMETPVGVMIVDIEQNGRVITISKSIEITEAVIPVAEYDSFKSLVNEWSLKKYNQLVLRMK